MGNTTTLILPTIFLAPVMCVIGGLVFLVARWIGFVPREGKGTLGGLLIILSGYGLLYLGMTVDRLIVTPARLQQQYLGAHVAGPFALIGFEAGGFQDPYTIWRYRLSQDQVAALRPRCRWWDDLRGHRSCTLYSFSDERRDTSVLLDNDELSIEDGFH